MDTKEIPDNWIDVGLGCVRDKEKNIAFFRVIDWDEANQLRLKYNLPKATFHITLGFCTKDIHDVSKGKETLVNV